MPVFIMAQTSGTSSNFRPLLNQVLFGENKNLLIYTPIKLI